MMIKLNSKVNKPNKTKKFLLSNNKNFKESRKTKRKTENKIRKTTRTNKTIKIKSKINQEITINIKIKANKNHKDLNQDKMATLQNQSLSLIKSFHKKNDTAK